MDLKTVTECISNFAPTLGKIISTTNPLAGIVISLIAKTFGADPSDFNDIANKINSNPEAKNMLQELEKQNAKHIAEDKKDEISGNDSKNARDFIVQETKITGKIDWMFHFMCFLIVAGFFGVLIYLLCFPMDSSDHDVLWLLIGHLVAAFSQVVKVYCGK